MERHRRADPLCRGLDIRVREMGVTQSHSHVAVAEQPRDDRHGNAVHDGVSGHRAAKIVQAHILDSDLLADPVPEREMGSCGRPGLRGDGSTNALCPRGWRSMMRRAQASRYTFRGPVLVSPRAMVSPSTSFQRKAENLAPATPGQQQQPDDVGLACEARAGSGVLAECPVQPAELATGQKAGERGAPVHSHFARGIWW